MAIDERARHQLYLRLEEHLGAEAATTLMEHLPPTGWAEVATKRDLDQLRAITKSDLDHVAAVLKADIDRTAERTRADLHKTITTHTVLILSATMASSISAVFAVAQLR
jgi:hypothetical protein